MFSINYKKNKNVELYNSLKGINNSFSKIINYNPIYKLFFSLNETNWNSINLNEKNHIREIKEQQDETIFTGLLENGEKKSTFFKYSPLIDPIRYLAGKLDDISLNNICFTPKYDSIKITNDNYKNVYNYSKELFKNNDCSGYILNKINTPYNTAYTESFFSYLSSQLLNHHNFVHGVDFYGSFTCIKKNFVINIADDIEALQQSTFFFNKCIGSIVKVQDDFKEMINFDTRKNKEKIILNKTKSAISINSCETFDGIFKNTNEQSNENKEQIKLRDIDDINKFMILDNDFDTNSKTSNSYDDDDSSISDSNTTITTDENDSNCLDELDYEKEINNNNSVRSSKSSQSYNYSSVSSDSGSCETSIDEEFCGITIEKFPIHTICLEKLEDTLDNYMTNNNISNKEWQSILMQIIMTLITYQKTFSFTHNDLHTNNIMYNETDKLFLYYKFDNKYYKVPTYGKIYKIIDFGRAIYKYNNINIMCDAYNIDEDAYGQYNHEPFFDNTKPRISPNFSFDLTRLACSLFDHFIPDEMNIEKYDGIIENLIKDWVTDDSGKNILYKSNGKERYPGFKLYKIIAKQVHNHTPINQLNRDIFKCFNRISQDMQREIMNDKNILFMDIDLITQFTE